MQVVAHAGQQTALMIAMLSANRMCSAAQWRVG
jgi:hypothetical protein